MARGVVIPLDRVPSQLWCHDDGKLRDAEGVEYVPGLDGQAYYQSEDREGFRRQMVRVTIPGVRDFAMAISGDEVPDLTVEHSSSPEI